MEEASTRLTRGWVSRRELWAQPVRGIQSGHSTGYKGGFSDPQKPKGIRHFSTPGLNSLFGLGCTPVLRQDKWGQVIAARAACSPSPQEGPARSGAPPRGWRSVAREVSVGPDGRPAEGTNGSHGTRAIRSAATGWARCNTPVSNSAGGW